MKSNLECGALNLECEGSRANHRSPGLVKVVRMTGSESFPRSVQRLHSASVRYTRFREKRTHRRISSVRESARPRILSLSRFNIEPQGRRYRRRLLVARSRDTLNFQSTYNATGITRRIRNSTGVLLSAIHRAFRTREVILEIGRRGIPRYTSATVALSFTGQIWTTPWERSRVAEEGEGEEERKKSQTRTHTAVAELWCTVALAGRRCYLLRVVLFTVPHAL